MRAVSLWNRAHSIEMSGQHAYTLLSIVSRQLLTLRYVMRFSELHLLALSTSGYHRTHTSSIMHPLQTSVESVCAEASVERSNATSRSLMKIIKIGGGRTEICG